MTLTPLLTAPLVVQLHVCAALCAIVLGPIALSGGRGIIGINGLVTHGLWRWGQPRCHPLPFPMLPSSDRLVQSTANPSSRFGGYGKP
jgi:hypothetical protein